MSVVMPMRNARSFVADAVRSILDQTLHDFELIVVDDASEDAGPGVVEAFGDARVRMVRNAVPAGIGGALNRGLDEARADLVARMDADDVSEPDRLRIQVDFLRDHPSVAVVGSRCNLIDQSGAPCGQIEVLSGPAVLRWELYFSNQLAHPSVMMRRAVVERAGRYDGSLSPAEDYDLWLRIAQLADVENLPVPLLRYRTHGSQASIRQIDLRIRNADEGRRRALSELIGREVAPELAAAWGRAARGDRVGDARTVRLVAALHGALLRGYFRRWRPAGAHARDVRRRAAGRLLGVARVNAHVDARLALELVLRAAALSPRALAGASPSAFAARLLARRG